MLKWKWIGQQVLNAVVIYYIRSSRMLEIYEGISSITARNEMYLSWVDKTFIAFIY